MKFLISSVVLIIRSKREWTGLALILGTAGYDEMSFGSM